MSHYLLCGWHVHSTLQLPELPAWTGTPDSPDITIGFGTVSPSLDTTHATVFTLHPPGPLGTTVMIAPDGSSLLDVTDVARFHVHAGHTVIIDAVTPHHAPTLRLYLLGTVLALLSYQRGRLPLHASCLLLDTDPDVGAVAIAGDSGAGKSTLAATFALSGTPILADDVCVVDPDTPDGPTVFPSIARVKLWKDAIDRLGIPLDALEQLRHGIDKYALQNIPAFHTTPVRLSAVYHLTTTTDLSPYPPHRVSGLGAITRLHQAVYRLPLGLAMGHETRIARALMTLLQTVPVFDLTHNPQVTTATPLSTRLTDHRRTLARPTTHELTALTTNTP